VVNREQQTGSTQDRTALGVQVSPRRPIGNVNRTSEPGLFAKQCAPGNGGVAQVHGIPPAFARDAGAGEGGPSFGLSELRLGRPIFRARSSKKAGGLIPRIALDQCRVPERYRTRAPAFATFAKGGEGCPPRWLCPGTRSRASAQAGFIRPLCPGQHWGLRPAFALRAAAGRPAIFSPPCSSLWISFVKNSCRGSTGWRLHLVIADCGLRIEIRPRPPDTCLQMRNPQSEICNCHGLQALK